MSDDKAGRVAFQCTICNSNGEDLNLEEIKEIYFCRGCTSRAKPLMMQVHEKRDDVIKAISSAENGKSKLEELLEFVRNGVKAKPESRHRYTEFHNKGVCAAYEEVEAWILEALKDEPEKGCALAGLAERES